MNTLSKPHIPVGWQPPRDDDPTGVRDLLSSLPEPDPMPANLIERITASLAAEQAQRADALSSAALTRVTPMLASPRSRRTPWRPTRPVLAIASAAAAVVLVAVVGSTVFTRQGNTASTTSAASTGRLAASPSLADKAPAASAASAAAPSLVQVSQSGTRYTQADFVPQAQNLRQTRHGTAQSQDAKSSGVGPASTPRGLAECLAAIGAAGAQVVRADVGLYDGRPAMIIVATTNGIPLAYAVGPRCSRADASVLRPATPLP